MPEPEHRSECNVERTPGLHILLLRVLQQRDNAAVHAYGRFPRVVVDGFDIVHTGKIVINRIQPVIFLQLVVNLPGKLRKVLLAVGIAHNGRHRIEQRKKFRLITDVLRSRRQRTAAGSQQQNGAKANRCQSFHLLSPIEMPTEPGLCQTQENGKAKWISLSVFA
ncbi:hypothetical protein SDC9_198579 [bioreactor metagenome]|uniref:Uncharacterized protein n=1 Tax=bioreactor metagenome TaxID=1076179 RepID=A0A645IKE6_9ZZZZ